MKTTPLTPNEIRFILAVDATWTVLRQPVLTKIYHDEWAIGNGSFGIGSVSLRRREKKYNNLNNLKIRPTMKTVQEMPECDSSSPRG